MSNRFAKLFDPIKIGPVTAPNRFYQVPHCNGLSYRYPKALAAMRATKAAGGWGVVCTEEVEIHHSSDLTPSVEGRLWSDADISEHSFVVESIKKANPDALAGIELVYSGHNASHLYSREPPFGARSQVLLPFEPVQCRAATRSDLQLVRAWHRQAVERAKKAGYDIIYVYAAHGMTLAFQMLSRTNNRNDEYGGSLENRCRLLKELILDTKEVAGNQCAVAVRFAVDELLGNDGMAHNDEAPEVLKLIGELPDLWDVNISGWSNDSATSRFAEEGHQEPYISFVKKHTTKPVVGVGRYTSPDAMLSVVNRGVVDFIGAARPSIADPFLPLKIKEGRFDEIRECIGCNICVSSDNKIVPIRCTQNPTMGEEWRRAWHPEAVPPATQNSKDHQSGGMVLVVGAGPAGLEAARVAGQRGYKTMLAEATDVLGGRVVREAALPGHGQWKRVADWRTSQLKKCSNVNVCLNETITKQFLLDHKEEFSDIIVATGSRWRKDGIGRHRTSAVQLPSNGSVPLILSPDDVFSWILSASGKNPNSFSSTLTPIIQKKREQQKQSVVHVLVYDDDHYYLASCVAEWFANKRFQKPLLDGGECLQQEIDFKVTFVTPHHSVSGWTEYTLEQKRIHRRLNDLSVAMKLNQILCRIDSNGIAHLQHSITNDVDTIESPVDVAVLVTERVPNDDLFHSIQSDDTFSLRSSGVRSVIKIGDCDAPGIIATAVFAGHRAGRELGTVIDPSTTPFLRE